MNGFIKKCVTISSVACLLLTGCGDNLQALTTEEENIIVSYSSGVVAKANRKQSQGLINLVPEEEQESIEGDASKESSEGTKALEAAAPIEGTDVGTQAQGSTVTLTEALNMDGIEAVYNSYDISNTYTEGNYAALEALTGHTYIILNITLKNITAEPITCNIYEKNPTCQLVLNGETNITALSTILVNDFATYMNPIAEGAAEETVLIFQVKAEEAENIQSLSLKFNAEGTDYNIILE